MPLDIGYLNEKISKCPHIVDVFCPMANRIIENQLDKMAHCANCTIFKLEGE
ncbi:hypothetical protein JXB41_04195 [Candidatus Woesearchaeota archaeon]|nr:hypothetical protein [Candidatus Woesearchaeota archaeon]